MPSVTDHYREKVKEYLKERGPQHAADIYRDLNIPRGSIYTVLRCESFEQLENSRWKIKEDK